MMDSGTFNLLTEEHLYWLKSDFELTSSENTKVFYLVDTFDIIDFCFPFINPIGKSGKLGESYKTGKINSILRSQHIYSYLFNEYYLKPIIPDEYISEHHSFRTKLELIRFKAPKIRKLFSGNLEDIKTGFVKNNVDFVLAFCYGLLSTPYFEKFTEITSRLNLNDIDEIKNEDDKFMILDIFKRTGKSKLSNQIMKEFIENDQILRTMNNFKSEDEVINYLNNAYRDVIVMDRCLAINKEVDYFYNKGYLNSRYLFLYISSATTKSPILFDLFEKKGLSILSSVNSERPYNIFRNISQLYFQSLLNNIVQDSKSTITQMEFIELATKTARTHDKINFEIDVIEKDDDFFKLLKQLERKRIHTRENLELSGNLLKLSNSRDRILEYMDSNSNTFTGESKEIRKVIKEELKDVNVKDVKTNISAFVQSLRKHKFNINVQESFINLFTEDISISPEGRDFIKGSYHRLPVLLFYDSLRLNTDTSSFYRLIEIIGNFASDPRRIELEIQQTFINNYSREIERLKDFNKVQLTILESYINSLFIRVGNPDNDHGYQRAIIKNLEDLMDLLNLPSGRINKTEFYVVEIKYLLVWLYRRIKEYDKSIDICNEVLSIHPDSPRFLHGKSLALLSSFYEQAETDNREELLLRTEELIKRTIRLYRTGKENILVEKTIFSLHNTLCYLHVLLYEVNPGREAYFKIGANKYLLQIFTDLENLNNNFYTNRPYTVKEFPSVLDTIGHHHLCQCLQSIRKEDINSAKEYLKKGEEYYKLCNESYLFTGSGNRLKKKFEDKLRQSRLGIRILAKKEY